MTIHYHELRPLIDEVTSEIRKLATEQTTSLRQSGSMVRRTEMQLITFPVVDGLTGGAHPSVQYFPNGWEGHRFWMAYTPYPGVVNENPVIVVSEDGYTWETPAGLTNPIDGPPSDGYYNDTELVYTREGTLRCYWRWYRPDDPNVLLMMESSDGVDWGVATECVLPAEAGDPLSPCIVTDRSGDYIMWTGTRINQKMARYTSSDGITWEGPDSCDSNMDDFGYHWHPMVWREGTSYYCLSSFVGNTPQPGTSPADLYFGRSHDGLTWTFDATPLVARGEEGLKRRRVYRSSAVRVGDRHLVYISGLGDESEQIHVAEAVMRFNALG